MVARFTFFCLLLLMSSCSLLGKLAGVGPEEISGKGEPPARLVTEVPFVQFTGGVIILRGMINDLPDTLNFILDTGSGGISLDSATCDKLGLKRIPSDQFIRGIGGIRRLFFAGNNTLVLPGLKIDSLDFHISNYDFISSVYGVKIDGIIGYSFLKRYIIQVNYDSMKLFIYSPGQYDYGRGGELFKVHIRNIPVIAAPIRNEASFYNRYYFDMGAGLCMMLSNRFIEDSCIFCMPRQRKHKFIKTEAQGLVGKITMRRTVIQGIKIGKYKFRKLPVYLFDDVSNVTNYPSLGGLIGNDLLRRFNVTLNYQEGQIFLKPNSHFNDPFDYSYTGLVMYYVDGHIVITDVIKGSPAEKAGFKPGDLVLAVDNNFSNNIQTYRTLLKATGKRVQVIISRDGVLQGIKLSIRSIL